MTSPAPAADQSSDSPPDGLAAIAQAEIQADSPSCGAVQPGIPENVCVREQGHVGPHVAQPVAGGPLLQFENPPVPQTGL